MLHSTLPRAFLPPGLSYLGGYYGDDAHLYTAAGYVPCIEDPYARIPDQRVHLVGWEAAAAAAARPPSPSPLDLSLKPAPNVTTAMDHETLEVDDEDDRRSRLIPQRRFLPAKRSYSNCEDHPGAVVEETECDARRSPSVHSYHSYDDSNPRKELQDHHRSSVPVTLLHEDVAVRTPPHRYHSYDDVVPTKKEALEVREVVHKVLVQAPSSPACLTDPEAYHSLSTQKELLLASPGANRVHGYHQQLLLTPQHHLQGIHAPMTPPSTPSPPQCPRRRPREELDVTPPGSSTPPTSSTITKTPVALAEKPGPRSKKKHARRLKFDEDTSSPVSGTVILGPDEAVVTGDIDPAFNIVEVTEEARAELAKIENRLGPYQCKLCRQLHDDAFQLAQHRCSRIAHVEYRCPECDKRFSCPANLASHRRWHKPRIPATNGGSETAGGAAVAAVASANAGRDNTEVACTRCDAKFTRPAALRKHLATQHPEGNNNNNNNNNNVVAAVGNGVGETASGFHDAGVIASEGKTQCAPSAMHLVNAAIASEMP